MDRTARLRRLSFRAWHRGTKEADLLVGGFFDRHGAGWGDGEIDWFERLIEEQDVDIMGWAIGTIPVPERWNGPLMQRMRTLDYVAVAR